MAAQEIRVPDIGDFTDVPIIEIHVAAGDTVAAEDPLLTLESDKATLDVPSPVAGTIASLAVAVGDTVSEGTVIGTVEVAGGAGEAGAEGDGHQPARGHRGRWLRPETAAGPGGADRAGGVRVVGGAAHRATTGPPTRRSARPPPTPGRRATCTPRSWCWAPGPAATPPRSGPPTSASKVVMVDSRGPLGGVCLNVGCIPSKALLHAAKVIAETKEMSHAGLSFAAPTIDLDALRGWKDGVVTRLTGGLTGLAKQRKVTDPRRHRHLHLAEHGLRRRPRRHRPPPCPSTRRSSPPAPNRSTLPFIPHDDPRVIDSTGALDLDDIPERLLVLGGGIIGLEMAMRLLRARHQDLAWSS